MIVMGRPPWSAADINMQNVPDIMVPRSVANDQTHIMPARGMDMIDMNATDANTVDQVRPPIEAITKDALTTAPPEKIPRDHRVPIVITLTRHFLLLFPRTSPQAL